MRDGEVEASMRGHLERVEDIPIKNEYVGRVIPGLPCPDEVLALCAEKEKERLRMVYGPTGFKYPLNGSPIAYIKFGGCVSQGEVRTQRYVFNVFRQMMDASGSGPKVPEVYRSFERGGQCYIVMEFVDGETVKEYLRDSSAETKRWIYDQVANAMRQILEVPVPFGSRPGPVGGGFFYNDLFKCHEAPTEYQSIDRLQRHINKVFAVIVSVYELNVIMLTPFENRCSNWAEHSIELTSLMRNSASVIQTSKRKIL